MMKITVVLLTCLALVKSQITNSCPSKEDIKPCTCLLGIDRRPWISCESLKSADDLVTSVKSMNGYLMSSFNLDKSNIGILPSDVFSNMEIESLLIMNSNLTKLGDSHRRPPFLGLEKSLQSIDIKDSFRNKNAPLASLSLSHLKKLTFIQLEGNFMPTIGNNWFENGPYSLKELYLLNSNTSVIGSHAFEALVQLEKFALTGGFLSGITRDMFPRPAAFLEYMDLSNNKLRSLPVNLFSKMPSLEQVFLENNYFTTINEATWAPIWSQLEYAYFHGNPIRCNSDLKWIFKYRLPQYFEGYCAYPLKLRNRDFKNITITDLQ